MTGVFTLAEMREALATHEQRLAEDGSWMELEQIARTLRWLDAGGHRRSFATAAVALEHNVTTYHTASSDSWATIGGFWHLAGEPNRARRALRRAIERSTFWDPVPEGAAGVLYLLGELDRAARLAPGDAVGWIAIGARDGEIRQVQRAREHWLDWQRLGKMGPHLDGVAVPLADWDWIEESYRLEAALTGEPVPTHLEILRRSGFLREPRDAVPDPPPRPAPRPGYRAALAGKEPPRLEVVSADVVTIEFAPDRFLSLERYLAEEGWGARLSDGASSGEWILSPSEREFQGAALWAAECLRLRGDPAAAEAVRRLVNEHDAA